MGGWGWGGGSFISLMSSEAKGCEGWRQIFSIKIFNDDTLI